MPSVTYFAADVFQWAAILQNVLYYRFVSNPRKITKWRREKRKEKKPRPSEREKKTQDFAINRKSERPNNLGISKLRSKCGNWNGEIRNGNKIIVPIGNTHTHTTKPIGQLWGTDYIRAWHSKLSTAPNWWRISTHLRNVTESIINNQYAKLGQTIICCGYLKSQLHCTVIELMQWGRERVGEYWIQ